MKFTGERVVPNDMSDKMYIVQEHIARYNFALGILAMLGSRTILDAACGTGYGSMLMEECGFDVTGMDIDKKTINFACQINACNAARFMDGDLNEVENLFTDQQFDAIISFETIEHLDDPQRFLDWVKTHCKLFIFSFPINQPSEFHKHVFTSKQACELIHKNFPDANLFYQDSINLCHYDCKQEHDYGYIVGYAKIS